MTRPTNIGTLDQRITLETQDPAQFDGHGGRLDAPLVRIELWGAVDYDGFAAAQEDDRRATREQIAVTIRWRADITRDTVVIWRTQRYCLLSIEHPDTTCDWLILRCERDT